MCWPVQHTNDALAPAITIFRWIKEIAGGTAASDVAFTKRRQGAQRVSLRSSPLECKVGANARGSSPSRGDVHKKMLAVVVADVEIDGESHFDRQKVGTTPTNLRGLADWLVEQDVEEVVMESTGQYWRPVWEALEQHWRPRRRARDSAPRLGGTLHLAQAQRRKCERAR